MPGTTSDSYDNVYRQSIDSPEDFWREAAAALDWDTPPDLILEANNPPFTRWFPDARLNACHNAVDRHVLAGHGKRTAIVYDSPITGTTQRISYAELLERVAATAGMLAAAGVAAGDRVLVYLPMMPEAVVAMLACARLGAIHSVVFGGFAARELAVRIDDARPAAILSASCGIEVNRVIDYKALLDRALELATHTVEHCFVLQRPQQPAQLDAPRDRDWAIAEAASKPAQCVSVEADHPLYILYTSGTTGQPKGVVHDTGGYLVALQWTMGAIYDIHAGDTFWAASDVGWVVGHSYIVYAPLLCGATTVLYEGKPVGTPDPGAFWRVISEHKVKALFTAPTALRAIRKEDPQGSHYQRYPTDCLETLFLAGERCDPDTLDWAAELLGVPVIDHWWQTETGWAIVANCKGIGLLPVKSGSPTRPVPGYDICVLDDNGQELPRDELGALAIRLPLPPGTFTGLWENRERFIESYFSRYPGYYETGDTGLVDVDGYVFVMGRSDDVINVAGHRLSTGAMEEVLGAHPQVAECAVIGVTDALKGHVPVGMVVLKDGCAVGDTQITAEVIDLVREHIGPVAAFKQCVVVKRLPKTRSGKILRATMRSIADGVSYTTPATIDDPEVLVEIGAALLTVGLPANKV